MFAIPVTLINILEPLLGVIDTAILGHLSTPVYLSGVAIGAEIYFFLLGMCSFLRMGTTSTTVRAFGNKDDQKIKDSLVQNIFIALILGVLMICLIYPILSASKWFYSPLDDVFAQVKNFLIIRIFSSPASLINMVVFGWLLGLQKVKSQLVVTFVITLLNIILDFWFVIGFDLNSKGVAIGSLIATWVGFFMNFYIVYSAQKKISGKFRLCNILNLNKLKPVMSVNKQLFVRSLCLMGCFGLVTAWGSRIGTNTLAANVILLNIIMVMAYFLDGIANATEATVGKAVGASDFIDLKKLLIASGICAFVLMIFCSLLFLTTGKYLINFFTSISEVKIIANSQICWLIVFPLIAGVSYWLDGVFIGMGRSDLMQKGMILCCFGVFIPLFFIFKNSENVFLWMSLTFFMIARGLFMLWALRYRCWPAFFGIQTDKRYSC